ncbi:hypothetical protein J2755_000889 [Methanohalophilus levihalophilus]|uniref:hypothetical protein n=1 Tax=Methanohalophilus levihalophilus TaxID=1431282 RepID=UPI001AE1998B|nr:hypothetical protein [Methanohalophilus levihalophilus]MBP2029955.1 hypothetical protein [Methanohalophilus levihalophilus]
MAKEKWKLEILHNSGSDLIRWNNLLESLESKDLYFTPTYMKLFEDVPLEVFQNFGGEALLAFYGNEKKYVLYPFFKRPLFELDFYKPMLSDYGKVYDISSPWFFSGPLVSKFKLSNSASYEKLMSSFFEAFHEYCVEQNIVAEFIRLHPFIKNHSLLRNGSEQLEISNSVVYVDLNSSIEDIVKKFKKANRNCISKS